MPINYDQTYGPSRSNLKDFKPDPTVCTGDAWPQYTCTLKTNITSLKVYSGNQAGESPGLYNIVLLVGVLDVCCVHIQYNVQCCRSGECGAAACSVVARLRGALQHYASPCLLGPQCKPCC
jgi:hypothetical protein